MTVCLMLIKCSHCILHHDLVYYLLSDSICLTSQVDVIILILQFGKWGLGWNSPTVTELGNGDAGIGTQDCVAQGLELSSLPLYGCSLHSKWLSVEGLVFRVTVWWAGLQYSDAQEQQIWNICRLNDITRNNILTSYIYFQISKITPNSISGKT